MGKSEKNLPQEYSVSRRGEDIDEKTLGGRVTTFLGVGFFSVAVCVSIFLIVFTIVFFFSRVFGPSMMTILNEEFHNLPPNLRNTDSVIVNRHRTPQINDIIVVRHYADGVPSDTREWQQDARGWFQLYIKRLIATEGSSIYLRRTGNSPNFIYYIEVDGRPFEESDDLDKQHWGVNRDSTRNYFANMWNWIQNRTGPYSNFIEPRTHTRPDGTTFTRNEVVLPPGYMFFMGDNRLESHDSRAFGPQHIDLLVGVVVDIARDRQSLPGWLWGRFVFYITFRWV